MALLRQQKLAILLMLLIINPLPGLGLKNDGDLPNDGSIKNYAKNHNDRKGKENDGHDGDHLWKYAEDLLKNATKSGIPWDTLFSLLEENSKVPEGITMEFSHNDFKMKMNVRIKQLIKFAKQNPDKIIFMAGLIASSFLLYETVSMMFKIREYVNQYKELQGKFDSYIPKLTEFEARFHNIHGLTSNEQQKDYYQKLYKEMKTFYDVLERDLEEVDGLFLRMVGADQSYIHKLSVVAGGLAVAATGLAIAGGLGVGVAIGYAFVDTGVMIGGAVTTASISTGACLLSLKNGDDLSKARVSLKELTIQANKTRKRASKLIEHMVDTIMKM